MRNLLSVLLICHFHHDVSSGCAVEPKRRNMLKMEEVSIHLYNVRPNLMCKVLFCSSLDSLASLLRNKERQKARGKKEEENSLFFESKI